MEKCTSHEAQRVREQPKPVAGRVRVRVSDYWFWNSWLVVREYLEKQGGNHPIIRW
jgi:hypothetical protein